MERCSYFIRDRALFGSYPNQETVAKLEAHGVQFFIDLTCAGERNIVPYQTTKTQLSYPIVDRSIPINWSRFARFILRVSRIIRQLKDGEKIYLHCKGGHGRSGIVVAALLCHLYRLSPRKALQLTNHYHSQRPEMREKWRRIGSPQTKEQRGFIYRFFEPLLFYKAYRHGRTAGLSNYSAHAVRTELGLFPTAQAAFEATKNPTDHDYLRSQQQAATPVASKYYGRVCDQRADWEQVKDQMMLNVVFAKFKQNSTARANLFETGLRPIIYHTTRESHWSDAGSNTLGRIITHVRNKLHLLAIDAEKV